MSDIKELTRLMQELEDQLTVCMRCGMCQAVCPLFSETGREADVARGKLALLEGLLQEMFKDPKGVYERLNRCLLCGSCAANCPSGVSVMEIFIKSRAIISGFMGLSSSKKLLLRGMLSRPGLFNQLAKWGSTFQNIFTKPVNEVIGTSCARFVSPLIGNRHFMPLAKTPFHQLVPALNTQKGRSGIKVAFYVGCLIDKFFPKVAQDVVYALNHHGVGIFMPKDQTCCGIPAISSGDLTTFHQLVRHNLELFNAEKFDYFVTSCATCTSTIKEIWPMMADKDSGFVQTKVASISQKAMDINQFLVSKIGIKKIENEDNPEPIDITYHDPCHLKKSLGVSSEPRTLINAHPGYRLKEMPESDRCCGLGGSFNLQYYDLSSNIGKIKADHIIATSCSSVATGCPACMLQLSDMLSKSGKNIRVRHPIQIYTELLKNDVGDI
jgi:glycolate oxidase iron-sulfur subunit